MAPAQPILAAAASTPPSLGTRLGRLFPGGQFLRYLAVGVFNTLFGYTTYAVAFTLLSHHMAAHLLYLAAPLGSILVTPLNITVAFLGYKWIVFRTRGNYLREWLKCFAVYGIGMIPGLVALGALTRLLQSLLQRYAARCAPFAMRLESHLSGSLHAIVARNAHAHILAGYLAGALVIAFSTVYSFLGHKKVTFAGSPAAEA